MRVYAFCKRVKALSYWSLDMKWMALSFSSCKIIGTSSKKSKNEVSTFIKVQLFAIEALKAVVLLVHQAVGVVVINDPSVTQILPFFGLPSS